jgi:type I restriction enzyme S subunit
MAINKVKLGKYIEQIDERNSNSDLGEDAVVGISTQKAFISTKADLVDVSLTSYKKVPTNCFVYVPDTSRRGDKMALAYNISDDIYLVSSIYTVFRIKESSYDIILSDYLFLYFNRPEFDRYARFHSWGSAREVFSWDDMCDIEIELPPIQIQQKYAKAYSALIKDANLRKRLKNICPILIKGALEEAKTWK